ncbi:MAG: TRAP transporter substrate-binding protein [Actinomycetota bacterium]
MGIIRTSMFGIAAAATVLSWTPLAATEVRVASHMAVTGQPLTHAAIFQREVEERFPGRFDFKIYPSAQLGQEKALIGQVKAGSLEIAAAGSGPLALDAKLGVFDMPWLFADWEHAERALTGKLGDAVRELLEDEHNVIVLGIYGLDFRDVINKVRPIVTPDDIKGLKIRLTGSKFRIAGFRELGANPVPVPWSETFTALQTGAVDGAEATYAGFYEEKQYEVSTYLSNTHHVFGPTFLLASRSFFDQLSPEDQQALRQIGRDIAPEAFQASQDISNKFLAELSKHLEVNDVDLDAFSARAEPVYDDYIEEVGDEWIKLVEEAR